MNFFATVLAAGASRRLGAPKQLLDHGDKSLLEHAVSAACASRCRRVVVVLGYEARRMRAALGILPVSVVVNPDWEQGMSSSIRAAVREVQRLDDPADPVEGLLLMPCDQPRIAAGHLDNLLDALEEADSGLVASGYAGSCGAPAVFGRRWLSRLASLAGEGGAQVLLRENLGRVTRLDWPEGAIDVDTVEDVSRV